MSPHCLLRPACHILRIFTVFVLAHVVVAVIVFYGPSTLFVAFRARSALTYSHCSWASLLGSLPVLSAHSFASN